MENRELKPCPFCGGEATLWKTLGADRPHHILCGCGGRVGWYETEEEAIEAWNRRQTMQHNKEDIIKAMECHRINACHKCPYEGLNNCIEYLCDDAVSLIKALRANTVREMQAEIINRCIQGGIYPAFVARTIDQIAKEMSEGEK